MRAISSMATRHVLADLSSAAVAAGLPEVQFESVGGVNAAQRVADGEQLDHVFLDLGALQRLDASGHVLAGSVTSLMLSQVAVATPSDSNAPETHHGGYAFPDAVGLRVALQQAGRIGYSTGPSGAALVNLIESWGMVEELKGRLVQARPGIPVARSLAESEVDLGFQQFSELVGQPGVRILGLLPPDCAIDTVFGGAVATVSGNPAAAIDVLRFFASEAAAPIVAAHGFARVPSHAS